MKSLSEPMKRALVTAFKREHCTVCPIPGVRNAAETSLLQALRRRGLVTNDPAPRLTISGIFAANSLIKGVTS